CALPIWGRGGELAMHYFRGQRPIVILHEEPANGGMLHAFNAGFFVQGDDGSLTPKVVHGKFTTAPPSGITTTRSIGECAPGSSSGCLPRGAELWAFVPQELLPHLKWSAAQDYTHVAYMDLKPKVTDARIFCDSLNPN